MIYDLFTAGNVMNINCWQFLLAFVCLKHSGCDFSK